MNVLSLFDGMSCGMIALKNAGVEVEEYHAYEIDKYAVKASQHNFPMIQQHGDVFEADFTQFEGIDWLIGGSPCTYWSIAQKNNRETEASGMGWELFSQYVRALKEAKPKYFIYENNKSMSKAIRDSIRETFGFNEVLINSALVSAQNRQRYYWVGKRNEDGTYSKVDVEQPVDKGILLKDILECGYVGRTQISLKRIPEYGTKDKSRPIRMSYAFKGDGEGSLSSEAFSENPSKQKSDYVAEPCCMRYERTEEAKSCRKDYESGKVKHGFHEMSELHPRPDGKTNTISTVGKDNPILEPVCVAERGRLSNGKWEQKFESREDGKTNAITTVEKDNKVAEPIRVGDYAAAGQGQRIYDPNGKGVVCDTANHGLYALPIRVGSLPRPNGELSQSQAMRIYSTDGKSVGLKSCGGGMGGKTGLYAIPIEFSNGIPTKAISLADGKEHQVYEVSEGQITIKGKQYPIKLIDGYYIIRKLTVRECMRLQTVPEWYDFSCVSNTQAYKMLGNGWTCDVITHLIKCCLRSDPVEK